MARPKAEMHKRQITPRFFQNDELADLETDTGIRNLRLTMIGLWCCADEAGVFEWQPRRRAAQIYPYNEEDRASVEQAMEAMASTGFILKVPFEGRLYGVFPNWGAHNDFRKQTTDFAGVLDVVKDLLAPRNAPESPEKPAEGEGEGELEDNNHHRANQRNKKAKAAAAPKGGEIEIVED